MPGTSVVLEPTDSTPSTHVHRWRIAEQAGASSAGRCECGEERAFQNGWEGDAGFGLRGGGWLSRRERGVARPD